MMFVRYPLSLHGQPRGIVTDRLRSYGAAMNVIGNAADQGCGRWLNNRAENSHQPFRRREGAMSKFRDVKTLQKFASVHASIHNQFNIERHLTPRETFKQNRTAAMAKWRQLAARYSHNFDVRRLVRIKLTAPITSLSTQGETIINPRFFPAISGDKEENIAPGRYNRGESCVPPGATPCAARVGISAGKATTSLSSLRSVFRSGLGHFDASMMNKDQRLR